MFQIDVSSVQYTLAKSYTTRRNSAIISGLRPSTTYILNITGSTVFGRIQNRTVTVKTTQGPAQITKKSPENITQYVETEVF